MKFSGILAACAVSVLATAAVAAPQNQPAAPSAGAAAPSAGAPAAGGGDATKGEATFAGRCRACHNDSGGAAPAPSALSTMTPDHIRETLKTGPMAPMAAGLSDDDINNIVTYLTAPKPAA